MVCAPAMRCSEQEIARGPFGIHKTRNGHVLRDPDTPLLQYPVGHVLGGLAGAFGTMCICRHRGDWMMRGGPHAYGEGVVRRLDHELKLSEDQRRQVEVIVNDARTEIRELRKQAQPKIDAVFNQAAGRISAILSPEQKVKFEKFVERKRERMKRWQDESSSQDNPIKRNGGGQDPRGPQHDPADDKAL